MQRARENKPRPLMRRVHSGANGDAVIETREAS